MVSPDDGTVLGFVFLDVTIEVIGEGAQQRAEARREEIMDLFSIAMAEKGAGMDGQPGAVDYDRLAALFFQIARADVGAPENTTNKKTMASTPTATPTRVNIIDLPKTHFINFPSINLLFEMPVALGFDRNRAAIFSPDYLKRQ